MLADWVQLWFKRTCAQDTGKAAMFHQQGKHSECVHGGCLGQQGTAAELVAMQVGCCLWKVPPLRRDGCAATCCSDSITRRAVLMLVTAAKQQQLYYVFALVPIVLQQCTGGAFVASIVAGVFWFAPWRPLCNNMQCKSQHGTLQGCQLTCRTKHCVLCCDQAHRMVFALSERDVTTCSHSGQDTLKRVARGDRIQP